MPGGGVRLDGGMGVSESEASVTESEGSSIINISDGLVPSDSEDGEALREAQKYRMPDIGKTRLHLRTKEPLSPSPRPTPAPRSPRRQQQARADPPTPSTPRNMQSTAATNSPFRAGYASANASSENVSDSDFASSGLSRPGSIYTLGRASLQGQLAHLTSLRLPDANSLAKKISDIPTSTEAAKALSDASEQIRIWITKASDVLNGLNAEDDVDWAAAGGREGIEDVDGAINRFQRLVDVYLLAIEELQTRDDVASLPAEELKRSVNQMEAIITSWQNIKQTLKGVKEQVEIAMEWEQLWNSFLGEIGQEMEGLNRLVFEMEEKRHEGAGSLLSSKDSIDLHELETIVEERPGKGAPLSVSRLSFPPFTPSPGVQTPPGNEGKDDSSLLALFARMQPLRASLDFLPMRLSGFQSRGSSIFPSACLDLDHRKDQLEEQWKKLEADAESLRRELGEDRWIVVFRNAGRQALKMEESINRSFSKLKEALDSREDQTNTPSFSKKAESYEAKKVHYGPAIERVLAIIDRGVQDRLTVNGEILRLQSDMKERWAALQAEMRDMDLTIEEINADNRDKQLRDSVSTVVSSERSVSSSLVDTPGSSPASSVVDMSSKGSRTPTPLNNPKSRRSSSRIGHSSIPRKIPLTKSGELKFSPTISPLTTHVNGRASTFEESPSSSRPRWQSAKKVQSRDFRPLSAFEPSPYAKAPVEKKTNFLRSTSTPTQTQPPNYRPAGRTPLGRNVSTPDRPPPPSSSTVPRVSISSYTPQKSSLPVPKTDPKEPAMRPASAFTNRRSVSNLKAALYASSSGRRTSLLPSALAPIDGNEADAETPMHHKPRASRPASALAGGRRSSLLPMRSRGQLNLAARAGAEDDRPPWRP